jgi:hypothetical protein
MIRNVISLASANYKQSKIPEITKNVREGYTIIQYRPLYPLLALLKFLTRWLKRDTFLHFEFCLYVLFSARCLNLTGERNDPVRHLIVFGGLTIGLLEDDGWVSPLAANEFITPICLPADIYVLNGK